MKIRKLLLVLTLAAISTPLVQAAVSKSDRAAACAEILAPKESDETKEDRQARSKIVKAFIKVSKKKRRMPTIEEMAVELRVRAATLSKVIGHDGLFESFEEIKIAAIEKNPDAFRKVIDTDFFTDERAKTVVDEVVKKRKRLIVTTAVAGAPVNRAFLQSMLLYCKKMDAEILVYPADMNTTGLDPILFNTPGVHVMVNSVELGPWLKINNLKFAPKRALPLNKAAQIDARGQSQIIISPKMHVKVVPTLDNANHPHSLFTTGAITDPVYTERFLPEDDETIATERHIVGALVLERNNGGANTMGVATTGSYHMRHIEFIPEKSGFTDLDTFYTSGETKKTNPVALVLGDIHVGDTDQSLLDALKKQILTLKPKYIVLHDLLNGHSISHHDRNKLISMAKKSKSGLLDLEKEISDNVTFINALLAFDSSFELVIVPSNHNFWLNRWLEDGEFMKDYKNSGIGLDLAKAYKDGEDPVEFALEKFGLDAIRKKRVRFLRSGDKFKVGPEERLVELGQHGHAGANGAKGSLQTMLLGWGRLVYGHTHTSQRLNGVVNVGTSTTAVLPYSREGFSSWVQSLALVGENGEIQALHLQDGEWFTDSDQKKLATKNYFMPGYPRALPNSK